MENVKNEETNIFLWFNNDNDSSTSRSKNTNDLTDHRRTSNTDEASRRIEESQAVQNRFLAFNINYEKILHVNATFYFVLLCMGLIGNFVGLCTMCNSKQMRTPSFKYHKALMVSNLLFCFNWFALKFVDDVLAVSDTKNDYIFSSYVAALYSGIVSRFLTSSCGYCSLYVTLLIAMDRCLALGLPSRYFLFNRHQTGNKLILMAWTLSIGLHSWFPFVERRTEMIWALSSSSSFSQPKRLKYFTWVKRTADVHRIAVMIKDSINSAVRISYPIFLSALTGSAIYFFIKRSRMRVNSFKFRRTQKAKRRERSLFLLMIAVVILAFIQTIPRELKRMWDIGLSSERVIKSLPDSRIPLGQRLTDFHRVLIKDHLLTVILNFTVAIDRTLTFYVSLLLNPNFRKSVLKFVTRPLLCSLCCCVTPSGRLTLLRTSISQHTHGSMSRITNHSAQQALREEANYGHIAQNLNQTAISMMVLSAAFTKQRSTPTPSTTCEERTSSLQSPLRRRQRRHRRRSTQLEDIGGGLKPDEESFLRPSPVLHRSGSERVHRVVRASWLTISTSSASSTTSSSSSSTSSSPSRCCCSDEDDLNKCQKP